MKQIVQHYKGKQESVGSATIFRTIPSHTVQSVGSIIFLDHFPDEFVEPREPSLPDGSFAHPHRGIATFSYILEGEMQHYDSRGNRGIVDAGGIQWMNAGNGIVHDEQPSPEFQQKGGPLHGFQLWINLPAKIKAHDPEYVHLKGANVPEYTFENGIRLRVLVGEYQQVKSPIPTYTNHFIYHLVIGQGKSVMINTNPDQEYAAHLARGQVLINDETLEPKEMIVFSNDEGNIQVVNQSNMAADLLLFGGELLDEKIVPYGPFVMNSLAEIQEAYRDFEAGNYGSINY